MGYDQTYTRESEQPPPNVTILKETDYSGPTQYLVRTPNTNLWQWREDPYIESNMWPWEPWSRCKELIDNTLEVWVINPFAATGGSGETTRTPRGEILDEARELIHGERNVAYGSPTENFERIAGIWNVQLGDKLKAPITAQEVALLMIGVKLGRAVNQPKRDNFVDIAGYAACGFEAGDTE